LATNDGSAAVGEGGWTFIAGVSSPATLVTFSSSEVRVLNAAPAWSKVSSPLVAGASGARSKDFLQE
jgi:hypothetical protein